MRESSNLVLKQQESLAIQVGRLAKEKGLDAQNYQCNECKEVICFEIKPT